MTILQRTYTLTPGERPSQAVAEFMGELRSLLPTDPPDDDDDPDDTDLLGDDLCPR
jgi:hypothetical protein